MSTLNMSDFETVINDNFTKDSSLNTGIWSAHWGNSNQYDFTDTSSGLLLSGSAAADWNAVGIEQAPTGKTAGEGYGLYSFTGYAGQAGQGVGICFLLWPSDNVWLPSDKAGQATEIDLLESWDGTKTGVSTIHYYDASASGDNGQEFHTVIDGGLTQSHTYSIDWERGSLTYYLDGQEIYQDTTHVPLDYADGGVNETLGAEVVNEASYATTPTVQLYIQDISYSKPISTAPTSPPVATPTISLSAPGTVQQTTVGGGVSVTETITTTGITGHIDLEVMTSAGKVEAGWAVVSITNGSAAATVHLDNSGDYVYAVNNETAPTATAKSSAVTITNPTITLSSPGTVQETTAGGVTVSEKITTGLAGHVDLEVLTSKGAVEFGWTVVSITNGTGAATVHLDSTGDYVRVVNNEATPTITANSAAVTILPATITLSSPGTVQATTGGGANVTEKVTTALAGHVDVEVMTSSGKVESGWTVVPITNGAGTATVHFDSTGDYVRAVNNETAPTITANSAAVTITAAKAAVIAATSSIASSATLSIGTLAEGSGTLLLTGDKQTGSAATVREYMDGNFVGILKTGMSDGVFSAHLADVTAGAHVLKLTVDGSSAAATYDFTKLSSGAIIDDVSTAAANQSTLSVATHS